MGVCISEIDSEIPICGSVCSGGFSEDAMGTRSGSFRIGKVQGYKRGAVWYLCYHEEGFVLGCL